MNTSSTESDPSWTQLSQEDQINELLVMVSKLAQLIQLMDARLDELADMIKTLELGCEVQ